jgi:hypothetical protein
MSDTYAPTGLEDAVIEALMNTDDTLHHDLVALARQVHGGGLKYGSDRALGEAIRDEYGEAVCGLLAASVNWAVVGRWYREEAGRQ